MTDRKLKFDGFKAGDLIQAYDHEPMHGRRGRYVIGEIKDIVRAGDSDENTTIPFDAYRIRVTHDATFTKKPRTIVIVPMETSDDYDERITLLRSATLTFEEFLASEHKDEKLAEEWSLNDPLFYSDADCQVERWNDKYCVIIGNSEECFDDKTEAARYLYENWYLDEVCR